MRKHQHGRERRSHRKSVKKGEFVIDSPSAFREYLRFRPESILQVVVPNLQDSFLAGVRLPDFGLTDSLISVDPNVTQAYARVRLGTAKWPTVVAEEPSTLVMLDQVTDPRNLGAIVRTAAYFSVPYVIVSMKRQALLTQGSVATSAGGFALTHLVVVERLALALKELKEKGYQVIGLDQHGEKTWPMKKNSAKVVLVCGSEMSGLSFPVKEQCDKLWSIVGAEQGLESLNVAVACGIGIYQCFKQQKSQGLL